MGERIGNELAGVELGVVTQYQGADQRYSWTENPVVFEDPVLSHRKILRIQYALQSRTLPSQRVDIPLHQRPQVVQQFDELFRRAHVRYRSKLRKANREDRALRLQLWREHEDDAENLGVKTGLGTGLTVALIFLICSGPVGWGIAATAAAGAGAGIAAGVAKQKSVKRMIERRSGESRRAFCRRLAADERRRIRNGLVMLRNALEDAPAQEAQHIQRLIEHTAPLVEGDG